MADNIANSDWRPRGDLGQDPGMSKWVEDKINAKIRSSNVQNLQRINVYAADSSKKLDSWIDIAPLASIYFIDPTSATVTDYEAFIPTADSGYYKTDYVYIRNRDKDGVWDTTYREIDPDIAVNPIVYDSDSKNYYRWDGTDWEVKIEPNLPMTSVSFLGAFTDEFYTADGISGPWSTNVTGDTFAANGTLTMTGTRTGTGGMYCGAKNTGAFLPGLGTWAIETRVDEANTLYDQAGIVATGQSFTDGMTFYGLAGRIYMYFYYQNSSPLYRIYWFGGGTPGYVDVLKSPQSGQELYLRIEHSYSAPNHTFVFKYKWTGDGSWTTGGTQTYAESSLVWTGKAVDAGLWASGLGTFSDDFDYLTVEYTPDSTIESPYAFIANTSWGSYTQYYIYKKGDDDTYVEYTPKTGEIVECNGELWQYSGSSWGRLALPHNGLSGIGTDDHHDKNHVLADNTALGSTHTMSGATAGHVLRASGATTALFAQLQHTDLGSVSSDQHHPKQHPLNSTANHTMTGVENNFLSFDNNGLPKDSGKSDASYDVAGAAASALATAEAYTDSEIIEALVTVAVDLADQVAILRANISSLNLGMIPGKWLHDIDDDESHNGVTGATENNFMSFDANGLPKDSGHKDSDYEDAGISLLLDGTRTMTGNLPMTDTKYIGSSGAQLTFNNAAGPTPSYLSSNVRLKALSFAISDTVMSETGIGVFDINVTNDFGSSSFNMHADSINLDASSLDIGDGSGDVALTFIGNNNTGYLYWMDDENYFLYYSDVLFDTTQKMYFRDTAIYIYSANDTFMDFRADGGFRFGDGTNYLQIGTTGIVTLAGTAKRTLALRPDIDYTNISALGKPTQVHIGAFGGYSMPIYSSDNEELYLNESVPGRWDGTSNIVVHALVALAAGEDAGDTFKFELSWNQIGVTDVIPATTHDVYDEITVVDGTQYATYDLEFTIDYDVDAGDPIVAHDDLAYRLRRVDSSGTEIDGEVIVLEFHTHYQVDKMFKAPD